MSESTSSIKLSTAVFGAVLIAVAFTAVGYFVSRTFVASAAPGRAMMFQGGGNGGAGGQQGNRMRVSGGAAGMGFINGTLVKKDESSFSVKQRDGSMKLVLITSSTKASKMTDASLKDFNLDQQVMITGTANSDGSVTAQTVQIRSADMPGFGGPGGIPAGQGETLQVK